MAMMQRKWFRRGRALADFLVAFFSVIGELVILVVMQVGQSATRSTVSLVRIAHLRVSRRRTRQGKRAENASSEIGKFKGVSERPTVMFDSIAGLEDVKREIRLRTILPLQHPEEAAEYDIPRGGGVLLWGPPGCGKTLIARAVCGELKAVFLHVKSSFLIDQWVGEAEKNVAKLFAMARSQQRAVIYFDELDSLVPARKSHGSTIMQRVVSEFLQHMDGSDSAVQRRDPDGFTLVLASTNWPERVDKAALRPPRFSTRIFVGLPDSEARRQLLEQELAKRTCADEIDRESLVARTEGFSGADLVALVEAAAQHAFLDSVAGNRNGRALCNVNLEAGFGQVRPSVSASEIERYQRLRAEL